MTLGLRNSSTFKVLLLFRDMTTEIRAEQNKVCSFIRARFTVHKSRAAGMYCVCSVLEGLFGSYIVSVIPGENSPYDEKHPFQSGGG